ncbi:hypothetical protein BKG91_09935 [Rodentibacter caecimuris]|uniref:Uncharacterized protein n=1 Tax=Rodentibacter caecimuris TaxID=1796644 RepID=A0AAJ3K2T4_9PAST|nr:hypothetical protein AC062_2376 [Pasteurellaceae bacterium NI1060]OOF71717.1 hypothetical protein BKG90_07495 [Rodentibacter heylii]OOF72956.1 hypothetical protein BKG91_09935 [Rodentibacter heylii]OOF72968.1 hypothetical protein BKG99_11850 [Rodentibacter heylii]
MLLPLCKANSLNDLVLSLDFSLYYFEFSEILSKLQQIHFIHSYITPQNSTSGFLSQRSIRSFGYSQNSTSGFVLQL